MKDIFSDIYDKVLSFFTAQNEDESKVVAKSRLRSVLMQDRVGFSERAMQMFRMICLTLFQDIWKLMLTLLI